jgi:hypothetical protein
MLAYRGCLATNSTHEIRFINPANFEPWRAAVALCCSLSQLSSEIEGRPLGGGMLKLEPTEAERTLVVRQELVRVTKDQLEELDTLIRAESLGYAIDLANELILRDTLSLTWDQIQILREGLRDFRETRRKRIAAVNSSVWSPRETPRISFSVADAYGSLRTWGFRQNQTLTKCEIRGRYRAGTLEGGSLRSDWTCFSSIFPAISRSAWP